MLAYTTSFSLTTIVYPQYYRINEVLLDTAKPNMPTYTFTHSTENCQCPKEYTGLSCQDPNKGYYRYFPKSKDNNWIDIVVGIAKPCECNNKSEQCDPDTGHCTVSFSNNTFYIR